MAGIWKIESEMLFRFLRDLEIAKPALHRLTHQYRIELRSSFNSIKDAPPIADSNETMADVLELLLLNQHAIAFGLEEVALWIEARGSRDTHDNVTTALEH